MTPGELQLPDIAHALGNICRFTGHCSRFYSVAEHSINVALVAQAPTRLETTVRLAALLHDASEAYLNDVARPLKYRPEFKFYRDAEANLQSRIEEKYLGAPTYDHEVHHIVKQADDIMLGIEARDLMWRGAPPDSSAGLDKKEQAKYAAWLDSWPYVKLIPDELYYRVNVAQAPTIGRDGVRREWNPGAEWLRMVEELLVIRGRG
jgi:HD superfamily phosphodiesterase